MQGADFVDVNTTPVTDLDGLADDLEQGDQSDEGGEL
ncbi:hypothetical protein LCGC14_1457790 [marine sediment metagenome]|uniref:Uncharacterized protein n=1 Tax=marine sediment metagenome TaxID=412755 RepID=A0A0F9K240_9ZZZZ